MTLKTEVLPGPIHSGILLAGWFLLFLGICLAQEGNQYDYFRQWLAEDVTYIVSPEERTVFLSLKTTEEIEQFIESFWRRRNPDPRSPVNEFKEEHYRRIAYANENFRSGIDGWRTDRGRIYIVYGPPKSIERNPAGGTYLRPLKEGGGTTTTYPFEVWYYEHIDSLGASAEIEFVDPQGTGEYRLALRKTEKDALLMTPGAGQTLFEEDGMETRAGRLRSSDMMRSIGLQGDAYGDAATNPFQQVEKYVNLKRPPAIMFPDLKAAVVASIHYDQLPFKYTYQAFRYTDELVLAPLTIQMATGDLSYKELPAGGRSQATVNIYGRLETLSRQVVYEFEDVLSSDFQKDAPRGRVLYQRHLPLKAGRYKLNLVLKDNQSSKIGTQEGLLTVSPPPKGHFASSSLVLADRIFPAGPGETQPDSFVTSSRLKVYPNVDKIFTRGSPLGIYLEMYGMGLDPASQKPRLNLAFKIFDGAGNLLEEQNLGTQSAVFDGGKMVFTMYWPECKLPAGKYRIRFDLQDQISNQTAAPEESFQITERAVAEAPK